jgi:uncharacterized caspase-like protein
MWCRSLGGLFSALLVGAVLLLAQPALAQDTLRGVALVIGNGEYEHLAPLANPKDDARAVEDLLADLGFETELSSDRDARRLARDLADFVEDAEGADVAVVYYAGHGIEAGGENWLVPVDADISALDDASAKLVPISKVIADLRAGVGVTIVLLDACRDNPFPAGAALKLPSGEAAPVSAGGLAVGDTRGATALAQMAAPADTSLGIVIGFAAEPGKVALDGAAGQNSPYAAALIKHLTALAGAEFGQVMRLVGEEVYLRTGGKQRPWVNESLRRLLYFGEAVDAPEGAEGDILTERRQLLLTIAALPDFQRMQVERVAARGGVPMDALYGLLRALGTDIPEDADELEKLLDQQAVRLKDMMAERAALKSTDAEIMRLSALADTAVAEGALATAIRLHDEAKKRVGELASTVDRAEADVKARRLEFAEVFAKSAETLELSFRYREAADDWRKAFDQVERWDDGQAISYANSEAMALGLLGETSGDNSALTASVARYEAALRLIDRATDPVRWAGAQNNMGTTLTTLGEREAGRDSLDRAAAAFEAALTVYTREAGADDWASTLGNLGTVWWRLGQREAGNATLMRAADTFRAALEVQASKAKPLEWAASQNNLGIVLSEIGERTRDQAVLDEALAAHRAALTEYSRAATPFDWAGSHVNIGATLTRLAPLTGDAALLEQAIAAYGTAAGELTRERAPAQWATIHNNLSAAWLNLGEMRDGETAYDEARKAAEAALSVWSRDKAPASWATAQFTLGNALYRLGNARKDAATMRRAIAALELALEEYPADTAPVDYVSVQQNLAAVWDDLADIEPGAEPWWRSIAASRAALSVLKPETSPRQYGESQYVLGVALADWADLDDDVERYMLAVAAFQESLRVRTREVDAGPWARTHYRLGHTLSSVAPLADEPSLYGAAVASYEAALEVETPADEQWAALQWGYGFALAARGTYGGGAADFARAIPALEIALAGQPEGSIDQAQVLGDLGRAHYALAETGVDDSWQPAIDAYRKAADIYAALGRTRARATMLTGHASVLFAVGNRTGRAEMFSAAAGSFREAVGLIASGGDGEDKVRLTANVASALWNAGYYANENPPLHEAAAAFREVLRMRPADVDPDRWSKTQADLARVLGLIAEREKTPAAHDAAIEANRVLADFYGRDRVPERWASYRNEVGYALTLAGRAENNPARFEEAVAVLREAVAVQQALGVSPDLAYTQDSLCDVLTDLGALNKDRAMAQEAVTTCTAALAGFTAAALPDLVKLSETNLAEAQALLAALR